MRMSKPKPQIKIKSQIGTRNFRWTKSNLVSLSLKQKLYRCPERVKSKFKAKTRKNLKVNLI